MDASRKKSVVERTSFGILIGLSLSHLLNDTLQSVITAVYPLLKESLLLSFAQIGTITLVYQISASVFQPVVGYYLDRRPNPWFLPAGMCFTLSGLLLLAFSGSLHLVLASVFLVGIGSSILHPEACRLTSLASGGKRGLAQSVFQLGGSLGGSFGPLLAALLIAPYGQRNIAFLALLALLAIVVMWPVCRWYKAKLSRMKREHQPMEPGRRGAGLPRKTLIVSLIVLLILLFSKYVYLSSITSYYTFYLIEKFGVSVQDSQFYLFAFLLAVAVGTLFGGPIGDRVGRKYVIWVSILGVAPFTLLMPHVGLAATCVLSIVIGLILSSAFSAILVYAQELLPLRLGLISGLFFGLAFGIGGLASAALGVVADARDIEFVYRLCAYMPLLGLVAGFLPNLRNRT